MENQMSFTSHAQARVQQRGIKKEVIDFILMEADQDKPAGRGCRSLFVSKRKLAKLVKNNELMPKFASRVSGVVIVEAEDEIVTIYHKSRRLH